MGQRSSVACVIGQVIINNTNKYGSPSQSTVKYATVESVKLPNHYVLHYTIILVSNTSPYWHIHLLGLSVSYDIPLSVYPLLLITAAWICLWQRWSEIRETVWIKHVCELLTKEEIDNNIMTT